MKRTTAFAAAAAAAAAAGAAAFALGTADAADGRDVSSRTEESSVTTNDNGVVSRAYTECSVTTNGNMVTERRRETRTNMDQDGNVFETSTSEFAQSYSVGDSGAAAFAAASAGAESGPAPRDSSSFLGLAFGEPARNGGNGIRGRSRRARPAARGVRPEDAARRVRPLFRVRDPEDAPGGENPRLRGERGHAGKNSFHGLRSSSGAT